MMRGMLYALPGEGTDQALAQEGSRVVVLGRGGVAARRAAGRRQTDLRDFGRAVAARAWPGCPLAAGRNGAASGSHGQRGGGGAPDVVGTRAPEPVAPLRATRRGGGSDLLSDQPVCRGEPDLTLAVLESLPLRWVVRLDQEAAPVRRQQAQD